MLRCVRLESCCTYNHLFSDCHWLVTFTLHSSLYLIGWTAWERTCQLDWCALTGLTLNYWNFLYSSADVKMSFWWIEADSYMSAPPYGLEVLLLDSATFSVITVWTAFSFLVNSAFWPLKRMSTIDTAILWVVGWYWRNATHLQKTFWIQITFLLSVGNNHGSQPSSMPLSHV